jgi:hypothetical protein
MVKFEQNKKKACIKTFPYLEEGEAGVVHVRQDVPHVLVEPNGTLVLAKEWKEGFEPAAGAELEGRRDPVEGGQVAHHQFNSFCGQCDDF